MKNKIHRIAITGGPCALKTTFLTYIQEKFEEHGKKFLLSPEAATICINGRISPILPDVGVETAQTAITTLAYHLENVFNAAAEKMAEQNPVVVLYDRGIVDSSAYAPKELYDKILAGLNLNPVQARDERYDAVIHMVTAADGAEEFYTLANNKARYETPEQARIQDKKIQDAWNGHEHFRVVDNSRPGADQKIKRVYREICALLGEPPVEDEKKFLAVFDPEALAQQNITVQPIDIEQFYLVSSNNLIIPRLRKRGQGGYYTYYRTDKQRIGPGKNFETQRFASAQEYELGFEFKRPDTAIVQKTRNCFVYKSQYFEFDQFRDSRICTEPANGLLEIEITDSEQGIIFPPGVKIIKEVTDDPKYSNFAIAQRLAQD
jgi:CYTH domain-containing protein/thymidylate kinase